MAHELAENPEIQARLREEIDNSIREEPLSYDSVVGMKYLDMVVSGKKHNINLKSIKRFPVKKSIISFIAFPLRCKINKAFIKT